MSLRPLNAVLQRKKFIVPDGIDISAIKIILCSKFYWAESTTRALRRIFYDTFDWRIYNAGGAIEVESGAGYSTMSWRDLKYDAIVDSVSISQTINFACELPASSLLQKRIEPLLKMRALMPLVETHGKIYVLNVLNRNKKIVARLEIEEMQLSEACKSRPDKLPATLTIEAAKGGKAFLQKVSRVIEKNFSLKSNKQSLALSVFEVAGLHPGDYSTNLDLQLAPDMRSDRVTRMILLRLLETMQTNEAGLKANLDSEFLHDYRVAVRRIRAALGQIKAVFPQQKQERFRHEFSWLGKITSPTRDMDVFLIDFTAFKDCLPLPFKEDINPFHDYLEKHQKTEHLLLIKQLSSVRYRKLIAGWHAYLNSPLPNRTSLPNAMRPAIDVANKRIWRMVRRVISEGRLIRPDSPPEDLHELRKSCKKLRYLMEFFFSLYPRKKIKRLIKALKQLQDQLGEYQNSHVQLSYLITIPAQMIDEGIASERTLVAFDLIVQTISQRQAKARKLFKARFTAFADKKNRDNFKKLFKPRLQK